MGKNAPKEPDPYAVSAAQTQSNKDTAAYNAALNRIDQTSPFGSINYSQSGVDPTTGAPIYSQQTTLSPQLQSLLDSQIGTQQGISSAIGGALGNLPTGSFDPSGIDVGNIAQTSYDARTKLLQPDFDRRAKQLEVRLSERGLPVGSEAYGDEMNRYDEAMTGTLNQAAREADLDARNEYQRMFGNALTEYNLPYQTLSALMGNSSGVQNPSFSPFSTATSSPTDVSGNVWNAYNAENQAYQQNQGNLMSGLLGAGKLGVALLSDIRLKRDIKRIGAMPSGLPVYSYKYLWSDEPQIGVMAQEVLAYKPEAVVMDVTGYLKVRYDLL